MKKLIPLLLLIPLGYFSYSYYPAIWSQLTDGKSSLQGIDSLLGILATLWLMWKFLWKGKKEALPTKTTNNTPKNSLNLDKSFEHSSLSKNSTINKEKCPCRGLEAFRKQDVTAFPPNYFPIKARKVLTDFSTWKISIGTCRSILVFLESYRSYTNLLAVFIFLFSSTAFSASCDPQKTGVIIELL